MFFSRKETAYEVRIIDWSSGVCSSAIRRFVRAGAADIEKIPAAQRLAQPVPVVGGIGKNGGIAPLIGAGCDPDRARPVAMVGQADEIGQRTERAFFHQAEVQGLPFLYRLAHWNSGHHTPAEGQIPAGMTHTVTNRCVHDAGARTL